MPSPIRQNPVQQSSFSSQPSEPAQQMQSAETQSRKNSNASDMEGRINLEKSRALQLREEMIKHLEVAASPPTPSIELVGVEKLPANDPSHGTVNQQAAEDALENVTLALYSRKTGSFLSSNIFSPSKGKDEIFRRDEANKHIPLASTMPEVKDSRVFYALVAQKNWKAKALNCDGLGYSVADYVAKKFPQLETSLLEFKGHTVLAIGPMEEALLSRPLTEWPRHVSICDVWPIDVTEQGHDKSELGTALGHGIACPAPDYIEKYSERMQALKENKQFIRSKDKNKWISPTNKDWLNAVKDVPTIHLRRDFANGQFDYMQVNKLDSLGQ